MVGLRGYNDIDLQLDAILVGAVVTGLYLWWKSCDRKQRVIMPSPLSLEVDGNPTHRKSVFCNDNKIMNSCKASITTIPHLFQEGMSINRNGRVFGYREDDSPFKWISWKEADQMIHHFRRGLIQLGLKQGQDSMLGIFAKNSPYWNMTMQAAVANRNIAVPLYLTLGTKAMTHILEETELNAVVCDSISITRLMDFLSDNSKINTIISIGEVNDPNLADRLSDLGIKLFQWDNVCQLGARGRSVELQEAHQDDIAIICYTSGTTGKPKGALLTHGNIVSCMKSVYRHLWKFQSHFNKDECIISYLPSAHVYGFVSECIVLFVGGSVGYFRGEIKGLMDDILELKPTLFPAVPRVLNKIYDKVNAQLDAKPAIVKKLFNYGVTCKVSEVEQGIIRKDSIWDTLFFKKIQDKLGGKVKIIMSGSAPMQPHVIQWFRAVLGTSIVEGYGQTETSAASSLYLMGDTVPGHVGVPAPDWEIKLADVPEMGYFAQDNRGEVCVKGPGVFQGYYKQPEQTNEVLKDGWVYSGDIGTWTPEGRLQITDRKKNIFKLAQGEYIAPEKIEIIYERSPYVSQVFVYGESHKANLIGLVMLDNAFVSECPEYKDTPLSDLCTSHSFNEFLLHSLHELAKPELFSFEQIKIIKIFSEESAFSVDNDMMTPSFKKKRRVIEAHYKQVLTELYKNID